MKHSKLGKSTIESSRFIYGCMRIAGDYSTSDRSKGKRAIMTALDAGYNHFDHADIYGGGASESIFGELLAEQPHLREQMIITSKAGIRPKNNDDSYAPTRYDFSQKYLLASVEGSLKRLNTDHLDLGVSNFKPLQLALLKSAMSMPLLVNQVEINIHNIDTLLDGTLDQCQQHGITPIAWCPLGGVAYSAWGNTFSVEDEQRIKSELNNQSKKYGCAPWQVILAWLLKHPANIFPIIGSTTPERIVAAKQALAIDYSREDWYRLLEARNGQAVP